MDFKRNNMERVKLDRACIVVGEPISYSVTDDIRTEILKIAIHNRGQFEEVMIAEVSEEYRVIRGHLTMRVLDQLSIKEVQCCNIGRMTEKQFLSHLLFFNGHEVRFNYIEIAKRVKKVCETSADCSSIANSSGLPVEDIKRYQTLLDFDWSTFEKLSLDTGNVDLFGNKIEVLDDYVTKKKFGKDHIDKLKKKNEK